MNKFEACLAAVRGWLSANFLLLNPAKTELLVIGPQKLSLLHENVAITMDDVVIHSREKVRNLGVFFDRTLVFESHVKEVTKVAFFHLKKIARIRPILSFKDAEVLIHAFITSCLDYCNALLSGLPKRSF